MKILHTSDWHLGQNFFNQSRKQEHQAFLNWLLQQIQSRSIDAVIVAGDIFDTGTPPSYAREMLNQFVIGVHQQHCTLILLAGNHDSVATLNESKDIMAYLDTYIVAKASHDPEQQLIRLKDKQGKVSAYVCAIPFLRPRDILQSQNNQNQEDKQQALAQAISQHYAHLYQYALEQRQQENNAHCPIIMTGHLTALGVTKSDAVRDIYIGTLDGFDANGFPPADYIALGHIHRPQIVGKQTQIRYCGSPINLSFDELASEKKILLLDVNLANATTIGISAIPIPCFQPMLQLKGSLTQIKTQIDQYFSTYQSDKTLWCSINVTSENFRQDLLVKIQDILQDRPAQILQLTRSQKHDNQALVSTKNETLAELSPLDVFQKRLGLEQFPDLSDKQIQEKKTRLTQLFTTLIEELNTTNIEDKNA